MIILLLGAGGQLGKTIITNVSKQINLISFTRDELDITNVCNIKKKINKIKPDLIINCAAYTKVDDAEDNKDIALDINYYAVKTIVDISNEINAGLVHFSTDYVFDGKKITSYTETDITNPINIYGHSKLLADNYILENCHKYYILRTSWVMGRHGHNFIKAIIYKALKDKELNVINDQRGAPTSTELISSITYELINGIVNNQTWPYGIYNLTSSGVTTWYEMAKVIISCMRHKGLIPHVSDSNIIPIESSQYLTKAQRPNNSCLDTTKIKRLLSFNLPSWKDDFKQITNQIIDDLKVA